jgi:hypothetical protein
MAFLLGPFVSAAVTSSAHGMRGIGSLPRLDEYVPLTGAEREQCKSDGPGTIE